MNILFLTRRFYPQIGGVEKHVMELSQRLIKKGHKIILITEESKSSTPSLLKDASKTVLSFAKEGSGEISLFENIEIIRIPAGKDDWFKKFRIWYAIWKLRNRVQQADIIHCHDVFFWYLPFRLIYPRKRVYTTFHGYESYPISKKAIIIRKLSEKLSWGNISIGDFIKKWYGTKPDIISYGAVESNYQSSIINHQFKNPSALFFGRLDDQTGILDYVKAVEIVRKKIPDFELLVIGDGPYKDQIKNKVKVIGFQQNPEKYFQNHRFAFVSRYLSILEAMSAKRLIFALYDNPVKEDYLKMSPFAQFIIIEKDPAKLAEKIIFYLKNPQQEKQLIEKAYQWTKTQTWEKLTDNYLNLWNKF